MSLAAFIADQRSSHQVPHAVACRALAVSWFYKVAPPFTSALAASSGGAELDAAVAEAFEAAHGLHGSPRVLIDLRTAGWVVGEKTVAKSMVRRDWWLDPRNGGRPDLAR